MNIEIGIFAGFGSLGAICLQTLLNIGYKVGFVLTHSSNDSFSVQKICESAGIEHTIHDIRKKEVPELAKIENKHQKLMISVNYRYILPPELLNAFRLSLNLHGSLLPKYRGRTPHVWAIINGERETGVTCHLMEATVDTGAIVHQIPLNIEEKDTGGTLLKKFEQIYPDCLKHSLNKINASVSFTPQDESKATYFGKRIPEMGYIDFTKDMQSAVDFIRAQTKPYPGAYCYLPNGRKLIVYAAEALSNENKFAGGEVGSIMHMNQMYVARFKDGNIQFTDFEVV